MNYDGKHWSIQSWTVGFFRPSLLNLFDRLKASLRLMPSEEIRGNLISFTAIESSSLDGDPIQARFYLREGHLEEDAKRLGFSSCDLYSLAGQAKRWCRGHLDGYDHWQNQMASDLEGLAQLFEACELMDAGASSVCFDGVGVEVTWNRGRFSSGDEG